MDQQIAQLEARLDAYNTYRATPEFAELPWEARNDLDCEHTSLWCYLEGLRAEYDTRRVPDLDDAYPFNDYWQ